MWTEAATALEEFSTGVVTAVDPAGYPVSVRQNRLRYDADTGELLVVWPEGVPVAVGPANVLCHSHDERLWHLRALRIQGQLERRGDDWVFVSSTFTPPSGMAVAMWRAARGNRAAGRRYLEKRGLEVPQVNWAAVKELHRRPGVRQHRRRGAGTARCRTRGGL